MYQKQFGIRAIVMDEYGAQLDELQNLATLMGSNQVELKYFGILCMN